MKKMEVKYYLLYLRLILVMLLSDKGVDNKIEQYKNTLEKKVIEYDRI